jgi:hypothetical protein
MNVVLKNRRLVDSREVSGLELDGILIALRN